MQYSIVVKYISNDSITQEELDNWNGDGTGISLEDYVRKMMLDNNLFDIVTGDPEFVCVSAQQANARELASGAVSSDTERRG